MRKSVLHLQFLSLGCAADRQQASIVFEVAADMVCLNLGIEKRQYRGHVDVMGKYAIIYSCLMLKYGSTLISG